MRDGRDAGEDWLRGQDVPGRKKKKKRFKKNSSFLHTLIFHQPQIVVCEVSLFAAAPFGLNGACERRTVMGGSLDCQLVMSRSYCRPTLTQPT